MLLLCELCPAAYHFVCAGYYDESGMHHPGLLLQSACRHCKGSFKHCLSLITTLLPSEGAQTVALASKICCPAHISNTACTSCHLSASLPTSHGLSLAVRLVKTAAHSKQLSQRRSSRVILTVT